MNAGSFKKGEKRPNQGKRGPGKVTLKGREALAAVINGNADRLQGWLDLIEKREGPASAFRAYVSLVEFVVPKMSRSELASESGPITMQVRWMTPSENPQSEHRQNTDQEDDDFP